MFELKKNYNMWLVILVTQGSHLYHVNGLLFIMRLILWTFFYSTKTALHPKGYTQTCSHFIYHNTLDKGNKST